MLTAAGSALVNGTSPTHMEKTKRVKVLRPFLIRAVRQEVGTVLDLPAALAHELVSANKAEFTTAEPVKEPEPKPAVKTVKKES